MNNKRKTLQKIMGVSAVGITMPNAWIKPIVNSIVIPAHAQTSQVTIQAKVDGCGVGRIDGDNVTENPFVMENITRPFTSSIYVFGDATPLPQDDCVVEIIAPPSFSASPATVRAEQFETLTTSVNILDDKNEVIQTIEVEVDWFE